MADSQLNSKLQNFNLWKQQLSNTATELSTWLDKHRLNSNELRERIQHNLNTLDQDKLTIAFVAEFSRGKTELINAIFFSEYGRRLLPSTAGRTTMCPTELLWDSKYKGACVKLLPIETRLHDNSIQQLKNEPQQWVTLELDLKSANQIEETLNEVVRTKQVSVNEAGKLGLFTEGLHDQDGNEPDVVDIPKWRHAIINFPHPLLKKGLVLLDTPGLNALGNEPELTIDMLPAAQAVLFVLAADTGVTRSDLEMWQNHIKGYQSKRQSGLIVALNKIDTLWDELRDNDDIDATVEKQKHYTSRVLGISESSIFPVSAQKGLLAKVKNDSALLNKSGITLLEKHISEDVLDTKYQILSEKVKEDILNLIDNSKAVVNSRLTGIRKQKVELQKLEGKSDNVVNQLLQTTRKEQVRYLNNVNTYKSAISKLKIRGKTMLDTLDPIALQSRIDNAHEDLTDRWTTAGLRKAMRALFDDIRMNMQNIAEESEHTRKLIRTIYRRFQNEHGFAVSQPKMFSIMKYRVELELLYQEAGIFTKSTRTTLTEKHFLIKRFFSTLVKRAQQILTQARQEAKLWLSTVMEPLSVQIRDHRELMNKRLINLKKVSGSRDTLSERMNRLDKEYRLTAFQIASLRNFHTRITESKPMEKPQRPRLVTSKTQVAS